MSSAMRAVIALVVPLSFALGIPIRGQDAETVTRSAFVPSPARGDALIVAVAHKAARLKRTLDDKGFSGSVTFVNDWSRNFVGGANPASSLDRYSLDLSVTLDTRKSMGWNGGTGFFRLKNHAGENGADYVGDAQGFSNIDDVSRTHLYELWYEQKASEDRMRFKLGKIDANTEFAVVRAAGDFFNSSMGYSPTILALPTYPEPRPGLTVFVIPKQHYQASVGLFRVSRGLGMLLLEGGREWPLPQNGLRGRFSLGMWRLNGGIPCFDGDQVGSTQGFYFVAEQAVWRHSRLEPAGDKEFSVFLQYGHADDDVSRFTHHLGGGVVMKGLFVSRSHDAIGVATTMVRFTKAPDTGFQYDSELATEAYYKLMLGKYFSLVPDVQFIHHPGGVVTQNDAVVLTPRLNVTF